MPQIAEMLQTKRPTVQSWKQRDQWEETAPLNPGRKHLQRPG
ncbi:terminase gpP N-terminus-related DNA-binding protein [Klebsiella pneumoniae]